MCLLAVPSMIYPIQNETITEGDIVTLWCNASGIPSPMVSWIKVGSHMSTNENDLVFTNIKRSEAGEYMCEASNECGNASVTARIFVQCKLTITCPCNLSVLIFSAFICNVFYELEQQQKSFINETNPTLTA